MNMEQIDLGATKYRRRVYFCRKPNCGPCREGKGHGPYWYVCRMENGRSVQRYLGATLPADVLQVWEQQVGRVDTLEAGAPLRLFTLGTFRVEREEESGWQQIPQTLPFPSDARRLLGYLLTRPARSAAYVQVLDALWPTHPSAEARLFLRKTLHTLTRTLLAGMTQTRMDAYVRVQDEQIVLAGQERVWVDADAFVELLAATEERAETVEHEERRLSEAHTLYRGEFLCEEQHAAWAMSRRQALHHAWTTATLSLADRAMARQAHAEAIDVLHRLLAADALYEPAGQRLIVALTALDRRTEALRVQERFAQQSLFTQNPSFAAPVVLYTPQETRGPESELATAPVEAVAPAHPLQIPADRTHQYTFVGRVQEVQELRALLQQVERNKVHAGFVGITGEAGMGKTRLVEHLVSEAQQQGWRSLWSRTSREECHIPYRVWTTVMQHLDEHMGWPWQEMQRRPRIFAPLTKLLPALRERLPQVEQTQVSAEQEEIHLWEAIRELLVLLCGGCPLIVVLDDLHWADSGSCRLLAYLTRYMHQYPVLLLATCRERELRSNEHLRSFVISNGGEDTIRTIALAPLDERSLCTLITEHAPLPTSWVQTIAVRAGGNPFFAEELTRQATQLHERGMSSAGAEAALPETIDALLGLRVRQLSSACQRLLSKAAVLGRSFALTLVATMETQSAGLQEEELLDLLDEALQAGMLIEEGGGTTIMYQFWHPLLVSHLYEHLSAARRAGYHRQAARALKQLARGDEAAAMVRHLLAGGAEADELTAYAERAGDQAYVLAAYPEATYYYTLTLEHLESQTSQERLLPLAEHLGECHMIRGNYPEARTAYTRALHVLQDRQPATDVSVVQRQALLWCEIGWTWRYAGEVARAHECRLAAERLLQDACIVSGPAWASTHYQQSSLHWQEGRYQEALTVAQEARRLFEQHLATSQAIRPGLRPSGGNTALGAWRPQGIATTMMTAHHHSSGDPLRSPCFPPEERGPTHPAPERPATRIERALAGDPVNLGRMLVLLANILITTGKGSDAITHLKKALTLFEVQQCVREVAIVHGNLGDIYLRMGQHHEAQYVLQQSLEIAERIGDMPVICVNEGNLGILAYRLEETERAETLLRRAAQRAEQIDDAVYVSLWLAFLAEVLSKQGKDVEARACLRRAFARGRGIPPCMVQAQVTLCKMRIACATSTSMPHTDILLAARGTMQRILVSPMLEAETRVEGHVLLAQILLLLEDRTADQIIAQALEEAERNELFWQVERLRALPPRTGRFSVSPVANRTCCQER